MKHDNERSVASRLDRHLYGDADDGDIAEGAKRFSPLAPFVLLALLTGARPGEVLAMRWRDVDLGAKTVKVWANKTRRERAIPMHDSVLLPALLQGLKRLRGKNNHICGDWADGKPVEIHARQWSRLMRIARLQNCPMKALRSTCVAHVASASPDPEYLLEARFGHGAAVSKGHYRQPLHGLRDRGSTVEQWLGVEAELKQAMHALGLRKNPDA